VNFRVKLRRHSYEGQLLALTTDSAIMTVQQTSRTDGLLPSRLIVGLQYRGIPMNGLPRLAVIGQDISEHFLLTFDERRVIVRYHLPRLPQTLDAVVALAHTYEIDTIWVQPGSVLSASAGQLLASACHQIEYRAGISEQFAGMPTCVHAWRTAGDYRARRTITLIFPEYDARWRLQDCFDARQLLLAVAACEQLLQVSLDWSPGHTARKLMQQLNASGARADWLAPCDSSYLPAERRAFARDLHWKMAPLYRGSYLYGIDKNSMYLAAATGTNLGQGSPIHVPNWQEQECQFQERVPGLYRISLENDGGWDFYQPGEHWLWGPEVHWLLKSGAKMAIHEAYLWPTYHQTLRSWAETLWNARAALRSDGAPAGELERAHQQADQVVKAIATQGLGWLAHRPEQGGATDWYRPDWWSLVVSTARARMQFTVRNLLDAGVQVVGVNVDELWILSNEADPHAASRQQLSRSRLGGFKHAWTLPYTLDIEQALSDVVRFDKAHALIHQLVDEQGSAKVGAR
jgi:hypothetical protein